MAPRGRWEAGQTTRAKLVTVASFRTWPGWRAVRPPPTSRRQYRHRARDSQAMSRCICDLWTIAARAAACQFSAMSSNAAGPRYRLARSETNFYSDSGLDRASERRKDEAWLAARLADPASRFVPVWRSRNYVDPKEARAI